MILFHIITVLLYRKVVFLVSKCISFLYIDKIIVSTLDTVQDIPVAIISFVQGFLRNSILHDILISISVHNTYRGG